LVLRRVIVGYAARQAPVVSAAHERTHAAQGGVYLIRNSGSIRYF